MGEFLVPLIIGIVMAVSGFTIITSPPSAVDGINLVWSFGVSIVCFATAFKNYSRWTAYRKRRKASSNAVRSNWEKHIANHIKYKFPSLRVETNNRTIIRAPHSLFRHLEIDIWMPEIRLAIEANGEKYHDHAAYNSDVRNGTAHSKEMYKERFCAKKGIKLIHVWDSDDFDTIVGRVDSEIRRRMG